ncbi:MAG: HEPN domain-containing protein [Thermodesulfovibrionales bacterium]|jgi:hypothetical protein
MISDLRKSKQAGAFTVSSGKEVYGELTLAGPNTSLYLQDKEYFDTLAIPGQCVKGILKDLTKVTLLQCVTTSGTGYSSRGGQTFSFASIFPHFVVYGDHHIDPAEKKITAVHFVVDDATTLFYDFDAFGLVINARPFIEQIAHANALDREIATGPDPQILYFTGKREIFAADTVLGKVSASHNPNLTTWGGPNGVGLENTIIVTIAFKEVVTFNDMIASISTLLGYLGMLVGRPQNLLKLNIEVESADERPNFLEVYWSMLPKRSRSPEAQRPHPIDVLLDAVRQPAVFSRVLGSWLERQQAWQDARLRFFNSFVKEHYTVDRLIGSANMFDILPDSAVPPEIQLSEELGRAREECRTIFKNLPQSPERDSVLSALGRVGKSVLKHKIRHRSQLLIDTVGEKFPDLFIVTDEAVDCRNHYVHGSEPRFDYSKELDMLYFFTATLEFVFAASDLIEAGWDVKAWSELPTTMSHPFGQYRVNYAINLQELKALIASINHSDR